MRVLVVTQYFWPESFRINDLVLGLQERGHSVTVLTGEPNYPSGEFFPGYSAFAPREESYQGVHTIRVPLISRGKSKGLRLGLNYLSFAASASLLGSLRCRQPFDAILAFQPSPATVGLPALVLKWLKDAPLLFWVQDLWPESLAATGAVRSPWVLKQVDRCVRFLYGRCDRVLVQSEAFVPYIESQGAARERIRYLPNSAEAFFRPVELEPDAPEGRELPPGFRILFAGNIGASQSFATILSAAERTRSHADLQWVILGDGREKEWVQQQITVCGLPNVHLLGSRPVESMPRYYAAADALLVTLKRDPIFSRTVPSKLQSYLACGRPVLAALDGEGARVVADAGCGLAGPAEDAETLATNAQRLAATSQIRRAEMGAAGRRYFDTHFEREKLLDRLEHILAEVTENVPCAA